MSPHAHHAGEATFLLWLEKEEKGDNQNRWSRMHHCTWGSKGFGAWGLSKQSNIPWGRARLFAPRHPVLSMVSR